MGKIEMIGKRFGRWAVIGEAENDKYDNARWKCQCDCGTINIVSGGRLRNGEAVSCGCKRREIARVGMAGKKFGRLTVLSEAYSDNFGIHWSCICECGESCIVQGSHLRAGVTKSCGCLRSEHRDIFIKEHYKHGQTNHELFTVWMDMLRRCYDKKRKNDYKNYGGRGITVCARWRDSFANFLEDVGERPKGLTLERKNNDKGYSKENCYFATRATQNRNSKFSKWWYINGKKFDSASLAGEYFGVCHATIINWCKSRLKPDCYSEFKYGELQCL